MENRVKEQQLGLSGADWATKQVGTLRTGLLKIGAVIVRNTRRIKVKLSGGWPHRGIFIEAHSRLRAGA